MTPGSYALYWGASFLILLLPGLFLVHSIEILRRRVGAGERIVPAFLLSAGVLGLVYAASLALHLSLSIALGLELGLTAALGLLALLRLRAPASEPLPMIPTPPTSRTITRLVLLLIAVVTLVMLRAGGSLGYVHDSLDFVAFVQRMLLTHRVDLAVAAYPDAGNLAPDPRRGAFHLAAAFLCQLSGVHPTDMWRALPTVLVPLALWIFYATTRRVMRSASVAAWGTLAFVLATLFDRDRFLQNLGYASRIGWVYSWVGLWAIALWIDAGRADETPPPDWRPFRPPKRDHALLLLAIATPPILVGVHILSALQALLSLGALTWTWAILLPEPPAVRRSLALVPLWSALALAPLVALQVGRTYSSANPLFDHPQGLLYVAGSWAVLGPSALARWFGWPGLIGVVAALLAGRHARWDRGASFLLGSTLVTILIVLNPLCVAVIEGAKAHSVLFRVLYVAPIYPALGWVLSWIVTRVREASYRRVIAAGLALVVLAAYALQIDGALRFWGEAGPRYLAFQESVPLRKALAFLEARESTPLTIASDPITSYQIPAYSRHYAMCPYNQHSSPSDASAIERTYDAHAIRNALVSPSETWRRIEKYDVRYLILNQSYPRYLRSYLTFISPSTFAAERWKLDRDPERYARVYAEDGVSVYRVNRALGAPATTRSTTDSLIIGSEGAAPSLDTLRVVDASAAGARSREELARELGIDLAPTPVVEGLELLGVTYPNAELASDAVPRFRRGSTIHLRSYWRQLAPVGLPVEAFIRAEAINGDALLNHPLLGRLRRAWLERRDHEVLRFGRNHQPLETWYPPYLWEQGAVYRDDYWLPIPKNAPLGRYRLRLQLAVTPYAPNIRLGDLFSMHDSFEGPVLREVEIVE